MRSSIAAVLLVLSSPAIAQEPPIAQQPPPTFPIPADMREDWPGANLNEAEKVLLQRAMAAELRHQGEDSESAKKYSFRSIDTVDVALGKLGKAVVVKMSASFLCGTGGCPIYVYVREKEGYRKVLRTFGWAFAVVGSKTAAAPAFVIASNQGGGHMILTLYRYAGEAFTDQACDVLTWKDVNATNSWWDTSQVDVQSCSWRRRKGYRPRPAGN